MKNLITRIAFFFLLFQASFSIAQNFWVPDNSFRGKLKLKCPSCFTPQDSLITNSSSVQNLQTLNVQYSNIYSIEGIGFFTALNYLNCSSNHLSSLPALPSTLDTLDCAINLISVLPTLPSNVLKLDCSSNQLTSLPPLPSSLKYLRCNNNPLTSLPVLPSSLIHLLCVNNQMTSLPSLPGSLSELYCSGTQLTNLPALPNSLKQLVCNNNQLTYLPALPASLINLECRYNQLANLPSLPTSLYTLYCGHNQLTSLPTLPGSLSLLLLTCDFNQLTSLPALPASLQVLDCSSNLLSSLPVIPASLGKLACDSNQIGILPALPSNSLGTLTCSSNQLSSLPILPPFLYNLDCSHNQLNSLPAIPGKVSKLNFSNNPISCFPEIVPRLGGSQPWISITIDSTFISCIPNQGTFPPSVVHSSQILPFCSTANSSCSYDFTSGYVFWDVNGDGNRDSLDIGISAPVYFSGNSGVFPDSVGFFNAACDSGNITFQVNVPTYYTSTTPASQTVHVAAGSVDTLYFGLQPIPNINDLKVDLTSITFLRPGFKANYKIHYQNVGTETITNVNVKFRKPAALANLSSLPAMSATNGDTLIWNIPSLYPFQQGDILIQDSVFANAQLGDTANAYAWIEPLVADTTPQNNSSTSSNIIRGAYDPNDKSVSPEVVLPNTTGYLEYFIRFQNTGTDTAFAVMVIDTLSSLLNVSSLEMISASHSYDLWIENGVAKWNFINILLPDSNTNELESHGFVKFRIKPLPGLTVTNSITNAANIYFDYNSAVTTNTIVVNVLNTTQVNELQEMELKVFPNPVQESLRIVNQHAGPLGKIELINANGKVLETKTISSSTYTWNLQHLPAGTYILKGHGWRQKVVKE